MYILFIFFFNHPAPTKIYTLSLHDALPIFPMLSAEILGVAVEAGGGTALVAEGSGDRKSTRLNSSHLGISYAVFCLKKKKKKQMKLLCFRESELLIWREEVSRSTDGIIRRG